MKVYKQTLLQTSLLCGVIVLLQASSCRDKNKPEEETVCSAANTAFFPQDAKDRFFFKEGSWWVYENLELKDTDSMWVSKSELKYNSADNQEDGFIKNKCYENGSIIIRSNKYNIGSYYNRLLFLHRQPKAGSDPSKELFVINDLSPITDYKAIYRFVMLGNTYDSSNQENSIISIVDTITINKIQLCNVLKYDCPVNNGYEYLREAYYAKKLGLVKFKRHTEKGEWILIRHYTIQ